MKLIYRPVLAVVLGGLGITVMVCNLTWLSAWWASDASSTPAGCCPPSLPVNPLCQAGEIHRQSLNMPKAALAMAITKPFAMPMQPPFKPPAQYVEVRVRFMVYRKSSLPSVQSSSTSRVFTLCATILHDSCVSTKGNFGMSGDRDRPGRCAARLAPHFQIKMCLAGRPTTVRGTHALPIPPPVFPPHPCHPGLSVVEFPGLRLAAPGLLSRKNGASCNYHNINQLQQTKTAIRHQGKNQKPEFFAVFLG